MKPLLPTDRPEPDPTDLQAWVTWYRCYKSPGCDPDEAWQARKKAQAAKQRTKLRAKGKWCIAP